MIESFRLLEGLPETAAIFDVTVITADSGIEDVLQGVLSEEQVAYYPHALPSLPRPQLPQLRYCVYLTLQLPQLLH